MFLKKDKGLEKVIFCYGQRGSQEKYLDIIIIIILSNPSREVYVYQ